MPSIDRMFGNVSASAARLRRISVAVISTAVLLGAGVLLPFHAAAAQTPAPVQGVVTQAGFEGLHIMRGTPEYVTTPFGRLHVWSLGTGPAVILLHQGPLFSVEFARIQPLLAAQGFRAIAVDIPGFGFSERPDHALTGDEYADGLKAMLDHFGIKQAAVAGTHTGATVALAFAAHHPERTSCLVLQSVPVYSPEEFEERVNAPAPDTRIYGDGRQITAWWQRTVGKYDHLQGSPETMQWLMIGTLLSGDFNWYGETTGRTFISRAYDSVQGIKRVKARTLLMSVGGDHLEDSVRRARQLRPDFERIDIPEQAGLLTFDHPQLWADTVGGFIRRACPRGPTG